MAGQLSVSAVTAANGDKTCSGQDWTL